MPLTLNESTALNKITDIIYQFLPGKPHPFGAARLSFPAIAQELDLGEFWEDASKRPAISNLLQKTLEHKRGSFCKFIIEVVRRGIEKRNNSNPVTREEIDCLNKAILGVSFKIPELHDLTFLDSLPSEAPTPEQVPDPKVNMDELRGEIVRINELDPQSRGYAFEKVLYGLFSSRGLAPRSAFRNDGEQIDGSFELSGQPYLLEAKWQMPQVGQADLLTFQGKIEGKAAWTRGLFVSYSGFTGDGLRAFCTGRSTRIICIDGYDLWQIIDHGLDFNEVISRKTRRASESNEAFVSVRELFHEAG